MSISSLYKKLFMACQQKVRTNVDCIRINKDEEGEGINSGGIQIEKAGFPPDQGRGKLNQARNNISNPSCRAWDIS